MKSVGGFAKVLVFAVGAAVPFAAIASAQSGAAYVQWKEWCISQNGTPQGDASNPICVPNPAPVYQPPPPTYMPPPPRPVVPAGPSPQEIARRNAEAAAARKAEEDERKAALAAQQKYIKERDAAPLKGVGTGTNFFGGPKGAAPASAGIKDLKPATSAPGLDGPGASWKRLNCAAFVTSTAIGKLNDLQPDYDEFNYLAGQASNALDGGEVGVVCPQAGAMPKFSKGPDLMLERFKTLLARSRASAAALQKAQVQQKSALDNLIAAKKELAQLKGGGDAATQKEIATLVAQRQALGPSTLKPASAPPPPGAKKPKVDAAAAVAAAERALAEAQRSREVSEASQRKSKAELDKYGKVAGALEKGEPVDDLLGAAFDVK